MWWNFKLFPNGFFCRNSVKLSSQTYCELISRKFVKWWYWSKKISHNNASSQENISWKQLAVSSQRNKIDFTEFLHKNHEIMSVMQFSHCKVSCVLYSWFHEIFVRYIESVNLLGFSYVHTACGSKIEGLAFFNFFMNFPIFLSWSKVRTLSTFILHLMRPLRSNSRSVDFNNLSMTSKLDLNPLLGYWGQSNNGLYYFEVVEVMDYF